MMAQGKQFCLDEVDVIVATVDLDDVASYPQNSRSSMVQADSAPRSVYGVLYIYGVQCTVHSAVSACKPCVRPLQGRSE